MTAYSPVTRNNLTFAVSGNCEGMTLEMRLHPGPVSGRPSPQGNKTIWSKSVPINRGDASNIHAVITRLRANHCFESAGEENVPLSSGDELTLGRMSNEDTPWYIWFGGHRISLRDAELLRIAEELGTIGGW